MSRRDAFSTVKSPDNTSGSPHETPRPFETSDSRQPLDLIPTAQPRKKRNRQWEKAHRAETATYRGVPVECQVRINQTAQALEVPRDEVVRVFLEYGVARIQTGDLTLNPYPKAQRMTLFPVHRKGLASKMFLNEEKAEWLREAFPTSPQKRKNTGQISRRKTSASANWQQRVTYRIPPSLKNAIRSIATEQDVPIGEVVHFFLDLAWTAFQDGNLPLSPTPRVTGNTLFLDGMQ